MREAKDRSSRWIIQHHGGSILHMAGVRNFSRWRLGDSEVVHPKKLPDGFLEVVAEGSESASPFLIEVDVYQD